MKKTLKFPKQNTKISPQKISEKSGIVFILLLTSLVFSLMKDSWILIADAFSPCW